VLALVLEALVALVVLEALAALEALDELLLEPPHPAISAMIAATATIDNIQALRLVLVILTSPPQRGLRRLADS
jgi:hypothetical protein